MDAKNDADNGMKQAVTLTSEQAEILLKGDLSNLAGKVQQGKTLSASKRNLLQAFGPMAATTSLTGARGNSRQGESNTDGPNQSQLRARQILL